MKNYSLLALAPFALLLTVFAAQAAQADGSIICTSTVLEAGPAISMTRAEKPTGTVDGLRLHEGQITPLATRGSSELVFAFDSGIVHLTKARVLSDERIHGVLEVNLNDPARSILKAQTLSRVCEGISYFGHCDGSWDVLQSDSQPVSYEMTCSIR